MQGIIFRCQIVSMEIVELTLIVNCQQGLPGKSKY